jgi:hypothetical protein
VGPGSGARRGQTPAKPGSIKAARRAASIQQHAQRFTCLFGRPPLNRSFVKPGFGARRGAWYKTTRSMVHMPYRANPLRTNRVTAYAEWVLVCRTPLNWNFARPGSGARVGQTPVKPGLSGRFAGRFGRIPCARTGGGYAESTAVALRSLLVRDFAAAGSEARRATGVQQHAQCFACPIGRPPLNWNFIKPYSGARRVAAVQQHTSRVALGALAHEPARAHAMIRE